MVNLAEKHDEENGAQLADAEISRILTALNTAEFKRSDRANARPDQSFKPRSLMEIAETVLKNDEAAQNATKATEVATTETVSENIELQSDQVNAGDNRQGDDPAVPTDTADPTKGETVMSTGQVTGEAGQESAGNLDATSLDASQPRPEASSEGGELLATDSKVSENTAHTGDRDHETDQIVTASPFETSQAAYDRGYVDGGAAGRETVEIELRATIEAEFENKLAEKIDAFETALNTLAKPQTFDTQSLSLSLQEAVVRLASARIGTAIDELPELMLTRIRNLADAAGKNVSAGHVFMHPDDCAVIAPIMAARQDRVKIESDPELCRGDIRIRFDGMDISDIADLRADWQIPQSMVHGNSSEVETAQTKISDAEQETQTTSNLDLHSNNTPVQSSVMSPSLKDDENSKPLSDSPKDNEGTSSSDAIGLMPLTTTGGDDSTSDGGTEDNEGTSSSDAIGLMPLTTTDGDDSTSDGGTEDNGGASSSEAIGLMPLTSKNPEE